MYFPSKKDKWSRLFFYGFPAGLGLIYGINAEPGSWQLVTYNSPAGYITTEILIGLLLWIWCSTGYYVGRAEVKIKCGPFRWSVQKKDIIKISREKNPISAPALSIDRLCIVYGDYKVITISPEKKEQFIHALRQDHPHIKVEEKP